MAVRDDKTLTRPPSDAALLQIGGDERAAWPHFFLEFHQSR